MGTDDDAVNDDKESSSRSHHSRGSTKLQDMMIWMRQRQTEPHSYSWDTELLTLQRSATARCRAQMNDLGYENVFIGTVEGEPEDTACEAVIETDQRSGIQKSSASSADGSSRRPCKQRYGRR